MLGNRYVPRGIEKVVVVYEDIGGRLSAKGFRTTLGALRFYGSDAIGKALGFHRVED